MNFGKKLLAGVALIGLLAGLPETPVKSQTSISPPDPLYVNQQLTAGTQSASGAFNSGTVTNPTSNQVIIGPINTSGAQSWAFFYNILSGSGAVLVMQESDDAVNWSNTSGQAGGNTGTTISGNFPTAGGLYSGPVKHLYLRVISSNSATESLNVVGYLRGVPFVNSLANPLSYFLGQTALPGSAYSPSSVQPLHFSSSGYLETIPYASPETTWQYSTNGTPITTATTTTLQAAQAAGVRNYLVGLQCFNSNTTGTEVQVLDGASVIWDGYVGPNTNNGFPYLNFSIPLRGTAATAMSLKTLTTAASLYCSAQGYAAY